MNTLSDIHHHQIVAIIRGASAGDVLHISKALYEGGIRILEITMNSPQPLQVIEEVTAQLGDRMIVGAGTVLDPETARMAIMAGARFILSPVTDARIIEMTRRYGAVSVPGAYTATEILRAYTAGGDIVKVFPATSAAYIRDIAGPLPHIPLLPTGGIHIDNIREFKKAGAVGFGVGSSLVNTSRAVTDEYLLELTEKARRFTEAIAQS